MDTRRATNVQKRYQGGTKIVCIPTLMVRRCTCIHIHLNRRVLRGTVHTRGKRTGNIGQCRGEREKERTGCVIASNVGTGTSHLAISSLVTVAGVAGGCATLQSARPGVVIAAVAPATVCTVYLCCWWRCCLAIHPRDDPDGQLTFCWTLINASFAAWTTVILPM